MARHAKFRAYIQPGANLCTDAIHLAPAESRHLLQVRRARHGDAVSVFDGTGNEWSCRIGGNDKNRVQLAVLNHWQEEPPSPSITLAFAILKGKQSDIVIEKATELGVAEIVPLATERVEVKLDRTRAARRVSRWRTGSIEACKQSGNSFLPEIHPVRTLSESLRNPQEDRLNLVASLEAAAAPLDSATVSTSTSSVSWLIGPEGDFSPDEYRQIREAGYRAMSLAQQTLRSETAAIVAVAATRLFSNPG